MWGFLDASMKKTGDRVWYENKGVEYRRLIYVFFNKYWLKYSAKDPNSTMLDY